MSKRAWMLPFLLVHVLAAGAVAAPSDGICVAIKAAGAPVAEPGAVEGYADAFESAAVANEMKWLETPEARPFALQRATPQSTAEMLIAMRQIRNALAASQVLDASANGKRIKARLAEELARLHAALATFGEREQLDWGQFRARGGALSLFDQEAQPIGTDCEGGRYNSDTLFFNVGTKPDPIVLQVQRVDENDNPVGGPTYYATARQAVVVRAAVKAVTDVFRHSLSVKFNTEAARLAKVNAGWRNYLNYGYSQYPWEAFINSWNVAWDSAPRRQWVFVHPEAAAIVDVRGKHSALEGALMLHGLGLITYAGATRKFFIGASATGAVTTDRDLGFGGGGTLHVGHTALYARVPHISLALLAFATRSGKPGPFLGLSVDLWRLVEAGNDSPFKRVALKNAGAEP